METTWWYAWPIGIGAIVWILSMILYGGRLLDSHPGWLVFTLSAMALLSIPGVQYLTLVALIYMLINLAKDTWR